jgi:hypothetical protein
MILRFLVPFLFWFHQTRAEDQQAEEKATADKHRVEEAASDEIKEEPVVCSLLLVLELTP